jgi:phosphoribosylglycinamide formyltransferase-1
MGTLLAGLLDRVEEPDFPVFIAGVITDRDCMAYKRARARRVPVMLVHPEQCPDRASYDLMLAAIVRDFDPDLVVTAGFMRILGPEFVSAYPGRIINSHPSLLPSFPGAHAVRDALAHGVKVTGTTVHLIDSGVDTGPVLAQEAVQVHIGDTEETLHGRIKIIERRLLPEVVAAVATRGYTLDGRKAVIGR